MFAAALAFVRPRAGLSASLLALALMSALSGCGGGTDKPVYHPTGSAKDIARDECEETVDTQMRLRGYPRRPSPDTPQAKYRADILDACMRSKGYAPD